MRYQALEFFDLLLPEDLHWLMSSAIPRTILSGGTLVEEAAVSENLFFIADGLFDVHVRDDAGHERRVAQVGRGQIIGEMSWLDKQPVSATIKAAESSSVLALPTSVLDQRIKENVDFAARLYRALAQVSIARLRIANALFVNSQIAEAAPPAGQPTNDLLSNLTLQMEEFKELLFLAEKRGLETKGQIPVELKSQIAAQFMSLLENSNSVISNDEIPAATREALGRRMQKEMLPYIQLTATAERFYSKPRGYAGDYLTIEMIYNNVPAGVGRVGPLVDECFLNTGAAAAVRNRRTLVKNEIKRQVAEQRRRPRITSLACGPARELFDVFADVGSDALDVTAIDIDQEALALLDKRIADQGVQVSTRHGNLIYLATGRQQLDIPPQDFIYSIGLIDYFNDKFVVKLLDWIFDLLHPGGRVMLGNFHPSNSGRAFMDHVLDWKLIHRDEDKMNEIFSLSKFRRPCTRILFEEERINLFAECLKE